MNTVLSKIKIPMIPPFLEKGLLVMDYAEKAQISHKQFLKERICVAVFCFVTTARFA